MIRFPGRLNNGVVEKTATVINFSVWDTTLVEEARRWIRSQLQKKRRVFQYLGDKADYSLFASNVLSLDKLKVLLPMKFTTFKGKKLELKEIVNADEFESPNLDLDTEEVEDDDEEKTHTASLYYDESSVRPRR